MSDDCFKSEKSFTPRLLPTPAGLLACPWAAPAASIVLRTAPSIEDFGETMATEEDFGRKLLCGVVASVNLDTLLLLI